MSSLWSSQTAPSIGTRPLGNHRVFLYLGMLKCVCGLYKKDYKFENV